MFLDNLHLMSDWAPKLERKLEEAAERAHKVGPSTELAVPLGSTRHAFARMLSRAQRPHA